THLVDLPPSPDEAILPSWRHNLSHDNVGDTAMRTWHWMTLLLLVFSLDSGARAEQPKLSDYFPPPESRGGWRSLLPERGEPSSDQKSKIREVAGVDWDKLKAAWEHNAAAPGATGLLVVRKGQVVGEWYKDADRTTAFNIYSSS